MNKLIIFAVLACICALAAEATTVRVSPRCPGRVRVGRNINIGAKGFIDVRGSGSVNWSVCDNEGSCSRGTDYYRGSRTRRSLNLFFAKYYSRRGGRSITARLSAGGRTAIGRCSFVVY